MTFKKQRVIFLAGIIMLAAVMACSSGSLKSGRQITLKHLPDKKKVEVSYDGKIFTAYIYPDDIAKPVLYPLKTLSGRTLTRGFPIDPKPGERFDHPHHVGLWLNYGDVNGLDFWNNPGILPDERKERYGYIEHQDVVRIKSGGKKGLLEVNALWKNYENEVLLSENTIYEFSTKDNTIIIDRITTLKAEGKEVFFKDNKEGMIGIRVARALELPSKSPVLLLDSNANITKEKVLDNNGVEGNYLSSEGITGTAVWGTRGRWMLLYGIADCENVALAIIDHPQNVGYPTYWHARDYGLFAANTLGQEALSGGKDILNFKLAAGASVTFKYRILVHSGDLLSADEINKLADQFGSKK